MGELKRVGDFRAPKDEESGVELRRQLRTFENNVSDMGDKLRVDLMARLSEASDPAIALPGQFVFVDTRAGTIPLALAKPTAKDAGKFVIIIDLGGSAGAIFAQGQGCKVENAATSNITVTTWAAALFCDGVDYWRIW